MTTTATSDAGTAGDLTAVHRWAAAGLASLARSDPGIVTLARAELGRRGGALNLVAAASPTLPAALAAQGLPFGAVTAEGYGQQRYHPGTEFVDAVEQLAGTRAQELFRVPHANVQPQSGSAANLAVLYGVLSPGDRVLSLALSDGGHLSHGARGASVTRWLATDNYRLGEDGTVDHDALAAQVRQVRPRLVICGGSAYPRRLDFAAFRAAADQVGALLLADVSHISGLVAAGVHPSPVPHCDVLTTSTYKQLCGPRGGLVLRTTGSRLSAAALDRAVFPGFQGTADFGAIAAKAVALGAAARPAFAGAMRRVVRFAGIFASAFARHDVPLVAGGTDTHMVLVDLRRAVASGRVVAEALERLGVLVNRNLVPGDPRPPSQTSGIRIGTNDLGFRHADQDEVAGLADAVAALVAEIAGGAPVGPALRGRRGRTVADRAAGVAARGYREEGPG